MDVERENWSSSESESSKFDQEELDIEFLNVEGSNYSSRDEVFYNSHFFPSIKDFAGGESKICDNVPLTGIEPVHYFELFFDNSLLETIVQETNRYESQNPKADYSKMKPWRPLTVEELKTFLGLSILMGHIRKSKLRDYWSTDPLLTTPIFRQMMTRNRYFQILKYLHFENNETIINHSLKKIKPVIDDLRQKFANSMTPGKNLCIDESLLLWKGRLKFKQYIPLKRKRFGIKLFQIVDCSSGFILDFVVYTGADTDYEKFDLGISGDIVAYFMKPYFYKGHVVYIDNWYSSPQLAQFLHDRNTGMCGTVKSNRKGMPTLNSKLEKGEVQAVHNLSWLVIKWKDKKDVYMITTVHELKFCATGKKHYLTKENIIKPICVIDYNKNMGGIDNIDRQLSITESIRKSLKWYRKLFFHLLDLALINAHALYNIENEQLFFPSFRLEVVRALLKLAPNTSIHLELQPSRLLGRHFPKKNDKSGNRQCKLCSLQKVRRRTSYMCSTCNIPLCVVPCFEIFHVEKDLL